MLKQSVQTLLASSLIASATLWAPQASASEPFLGEIRMVGFNFNPRGWAFTNGQLLPITQYSALFSLLGTNFGGDGRTTFALPDLRGRSAIHPGTGPGLSPISVGQRGGAEVHTLSVANLPPHNHSLATGNASTIVTSTANSTATSTLTGLSATLRGINASGNSATPGGNTLASKSRTNIYSSSAPSVDMNAGSIVISGGSINTSVNTTVNSTATTTLGGSTANTGSGTSFNIRDPYLGIYHVIALTGVFPSP